MGRKKDEYKALIMQLLDIQKSKYHQDLQMSTPPFIYDFIRFFSIEQINHIIKIIKQKSKHYKDLQIPTLPLIYDFISCFTIEEIEHIISIINERRINARKEEFEDTHTPIENFNDKIIWLNDTLCVTLLHNHTIETVLEKGKKYIKENEDHKKDNEKTEEEKIQRQQKQKDDFRQELIKLDKQYKRLIKKIYTNKKIDKDKYNHKMRTIYDKLSSLDTLRGDQLMGVLNQPEYKVFEDEYCEKINNYTDTLVLNEIDSANLLLILDNAREQIQNIIKSDLYSIELMYMKPDKAFEVVWCKIVDSWIEKLHGKDNDCSIQASNDFWKKHDEIRIFVYISGIEELSGYKTKNVFEYFKQRCKNYLVNSTSSLI